MVLSAVDMGVCDCSCIFNGRALSDMLAARVRETLPAIASLHVNHPTIEDRVSAVAGYIETGFRGATRGFGEKGPSEVGRDPAYDIDFVEARRAGIGPDAWLMIDIGHAVRWDVDTAIWNENGDVRVPEGPGLGVVRLEAAIQRYRLPLYRVRR